VQNDLDWAGRRRRPVRAFLFAAHVGLIALTGCSGSDPNAELGAPTNGPVKFSGADVKQRAGMRADVGDRVVFGATTVVNKADTAVTLTAGRLLGDVDADSAEVTDVRVVDLGKAPGTGDLLGAGKWPDSEWKKWWRRARPIEGAELAAGDAAELVFVVTVNKAGDWAWPQTALDYETEAGSYAAITDFGFQVCAPEPAKCSQLRATGSEAER
jgi:hypothetical protein